MVTYDVTSASGITGGSVAVTNVTSGTVSDGNATGVPAGATVTLSATPASGYIFGEWNVTYGSSNTAVTVTDNQFTMPAGDVTVNATFTPVYSVTIDSGISNGSAEVTSVSVGTISSGNASGVTAGATVTLSATPATGYAFGSWTVTDGNNDPVNVNENNQFTMPASNVTVSATFTLIPTYAITVNEPSNGTLSVSPAGPVQEGTEITITATPSEGYVLDGITVTGNTSGDPVTVTNNQFTMPAEAVTVSATFVNQPSEIYAIGQVNGNNYATNWDPSVGVTLSRNATTGRYEADVYFKGENTGTFGDNNEQFNVDYFSFSKQLATSGSSDSWGDIANYRLGSEGNNYWITSSMMTGTRGLGLIDKGQNSFAIAAGVYKFSLDLSGLKLYVSPRQSTVTASPASGASVYAGSTVALTSNLATRLTNARMSDPDVKIYYSINGAAYSEYTAPVALTGTGNVTLTAYAQCVGTQIYSDTLSASYTVSAVSTKYFERIGSTADLNAAIQAGKKIIIVDEDHKTALGDGEIDSQMFNRSIVIPVADGEATVASNLGVGEFTAASATGGYTFLYPNGNYMAIVAASNANGLRSSENEFIWSVSFNNDDNSADISGVYSSDTRYIRGYNGGTSGTGYNFRTYNNKTNGHAVYIYAESSAGAYTLTPNVTGLGTLDMRTTAGAGTTITVTAIPGSNAVLSSLSYTPEGGTEQTINFTSGTYHNPETDATVSAYIGTFTMPSSNVTVNATFTGGYSVTVGEVSNGTVSVDKSLAGTGETVTITASGSNGYVVQSISVDYDNNQSITPTDNGNGTYSFTMPAADVTVNVTFARTPRTLTVVSEHATVTLNGSPFTGGSYPAGTTFDFAVTPDEGYVINNVVYYPTETPSSVSAITADSETGLYHFAMQDRAMTIEVQATTGSDYRVRWERVTSVDELVDGAKYIVVYEDYGHSGDAIANRIMGEVQPGAKYRKYADMTNVLFDRDNHYAYVPETAGAAELTLNILGDISVNYYTTEKVVTVENGDTTVTYNRVLDHTATLPGYNFETSDGKFMKFSLTGSSSEATLSDADSDIDNSTKWTIDFMNTLSRGVVAEIGNADHSDRFLRDNERYTRFNAYTTATKGMGFVQLYRQSAAVAAPEFDPEEGTYLVSEFTGVELSCSTSDAHIYYTTDGTMPQLSVNGETVTVVNGTLYDGTPITFNTQGEHVVRAIAWADGVVDRSTGDLVVSNVSSAYYFLTVNHTQVASDFVKVQDNDVLATLDGKEVVIVYEDGNLVMGQHNGSVTTQQTREKASATVLPICADGNGYTMLDQNYPTDGSPSVFTLKAVTVDGDTYYAFRQKTTRDADGTGKYLAYSSTSGVPKFGPTATVDDADLATTTNVLFEVAIDASGYATIMPKANNQRPILYNSASGSEKFGLYSASVNTHDVALYWREPITIGFYPASGSSLSTGETVTITPSSNKTIEYSLDGGTTWLTYSTPIVLSTEGTVNITARATYNDGENDDPYFITDTVAATYTVESHTFALTTKLIPGKKYIIVHETDETTAKGLGGSSDLTLASHVTNVANNQATVYTLVQSGDNYMFRTVVNGQYRYLAWTSSTSINTAASDSTNKAEWSITSSGTDVKIVNVNSVRDIRWVSNYTFRAYASSNTSDGSPIQLYKEYDPNEIDAPVFSPAAGTYTEATNVTISSATDGATVYYTTETGNTYPAGTWTAYTAPIALTANGTYTYRAVAVKDGNVSEEATATYVIAIPVTSNLDFHLATSLSQLEDGMEVIIVNQSDKSNKPYALATKQNNNFYGSDGLTLSSDKATAYLTSGSTVSVLTLGKHVDDENTTTFSFYFDDGTNSGYIAATASGSNNMGLVNELNNNSKATLTPGDYGVMGVQFASSSNRNVMQFNSNNTNPIFSCYASASQSPVYIYYRGNTRKTLAEIEGSGVQGYTYTISDELLAVYAIETTLWCKDQGNVSIARTEMDESYQKDYMHDVIKTANGVEIPSWDESDQSNWVALDFSNLYTTANLQEGIEAVAGLVGKYLAPTTVTGTYSDNSNYTITLADVPTVNPVNNSTDYNVSYTKNIYTAANFMTENQNVGNKEHYGVLGESGTYYFFLNPKIQEVCSFTFAVWDADSKCFLINPGAGHQLELTGIAKPDWSYNAEGNLENSLEDGTAYYFVGVARHPVSSQPQQEAPRKSLGTPDDNFVITPLDLTTDKQLPTGIEDLLNTLGDSGKTVKSVKYVNVSGIVSDRPFEGVNIVVKEYTDGSRSTTKIVR